MPGRTRASCPTGSFRPFVCFPAVLTRPMRKATTKETIAFIRNGTTSADHAASFLAGWAPMSLTGPPATITDPEYPNLCRRQCRYELFGGRNDDRFGGA